jgi:hypothetical protein
MDPLISFTRGTFIWNEKHKGLSREKMDLFIGAIEAGELGILMEDSRVLGATCEKEETPPEYADADTTDLMRIPWDSYAKPQNID